MSESVTIEDIRTAVRALGLRERPVCAHASLRSFGHVEGGADAIVDAFLAEGCTLMVPAFAGRTFAVTPPDGMRFERNADGGVTASASHDRVYSPATNQIDAEMGALPRAVVMRPGRARGDHPLSSFAAVGPRATDVVSTQRPLDIYAPLARLAKLGGYVVLMGVDLDRMTLLHLAEKRSGRTLFRRWANDPAGGVMVVETGSCSDGFGNLEPALRSIRRETTVGTSRWQVYDARAALNVATHAIRRNQRITHCGSRCPRCDDATAGGPIL